MAQEVQSALRVLRRQASFDRTSARAAAGLPAPDQIDMRTILLWLLPIYNLFAAISLLRRVTFRDTAADARVPNRAILALCWSLTAIALLDFFVLRNPRFMAVPYVLFAVTALADWRLSPKKRGAHVADGEFTAGSAS